MNEREQLNERYLEAQLREELGIEPDLSEDVLRRYYAQHPPETVRRVIPPRRKRAWRPLAAAAAVLIAAGVGCYALVTVLNDHTRTHHTQTFSVDKEATATAPEPANVPPSESAPAVPEIKPEPVPVKRTETPHAALKRHDESPPPGVTDPPGAFPVPRDPKPDTQPPDSRPAQPHSVPSTGGVTGPPGAFPHPLPPPEPEKKQPGKTAVKKPDALVSAWTGDELRVTRDGHEQKVKEGEAFAIRAGDRIKPRGTAEFMLLDGGLLRLDGEMSFDGTPEALTLTLHDGALYADVTHELSVTSADVTARLNGVSVLEQRLHGFDVFCVSGSVKTDDDNLMAGYRARLDDDGLRHDKAIEWKDVQREFRFLRETPRRVMLHEDLDKAPGKLFGGAIKDGVLAGDAASESGGIGFYLREPYEYREGDVVRFRFRTAKACEMILQFGTVASNNWRYQMGGVKAGEWIEYELPLSKLYKTEDVAQKSHPGLKLKFFQLHPDEGATRIEIDSVEIVHQP